MVLVVVDMQPCFDAAFNILPEVVVAIKQAHAIGIPVLTVEYALEGDDHNHTFPEVRKLIPKSDLIYKVTDDGSFILAKELQKRHWFGRDVLICGVNGSCCVLQTMQGLQEKYDRRDFDPDSVQVLTKATDCEAAPTSWQSYYPDGGLWTQGLDSFFRPQCDAE